MIINKLLFLLLIGSLSACVYTENVFPETEFQISIPVSTFLDITAGTVRGLAVFSDNTVQSVQFDAVRGGEAYLFGIIKIREINGHAANRLKWLDENGKLIDEFSILDLQGFDQLVLDTMRVVELN